MASISGDRNMWGAQFPDDLLPNVITLILDQWASFTLEGETLEVPITRRFCVHLQNGKNRSRYPFRIDWEAWELTPTGEAVGRIDLRFSHGWDERVYFSIECKRLRVTFPGGGFSHLSTEYVQDGMMRYFNGQYADGLDKGGMLAYVMDSNLSEAQAKVKEVIDARHAMLHMSSSASLATSSILPDNSGVKETCHRHGPSGIFRIHHLFVSATN